MNRPRRLQFPDALYHVTTRGNRRTNIFVDDRDRHIWLRILTETCAHFNLRIYSLCLMPNHVHFLVQTPEANISAALHRLNGVYAQKFNWRHGLTGHLLQGRFHAELVERQEHLLEVLRYIVLNPVAAELVTHPDRWQWSTHQCICGALPRPKWLDADWVLGLFTGEDRTERIGAYRRFVESAIAELAGSGKKRPRRAVVQGDGGPTLDEIERTHQSRNAAILAAWYSGAFTREQIARHFGISTKTVTRITSSAGK
ncbi:REP element-mobilizing transposase RayT [Pseudoduganella flava]|uniref:Addiction module toxin RelE n=1 Tax=Pseudoduganella flava TaxID=871742 RepID=A0A562PV87_9BURK|nr:transposase [Pseudoduganella flava]QGZ39451.1 addiction module toxin RelE [Pseudoduganella flava]TWI48334.1 REP element-mobilizing transposase RayT [Pseudoduganella flava]